MKVCRFHPAGAEVRIAAMDESGAVVDLTAAGLSHLAPLLSADDPAAAARALCRGNLPRLDPAGLRFAAPVERQEVWAAGVTYQRSKAARMEESDFSATAYDRVYAAVRPELFFKSTADRVVPHGEPVGIRRDARWSVPEPELALVLNARGQVAGYTAGNDMSSRDIEGENLLYLPQAKIYDRSCALGPWIVLGTPEDAARQWRISVAIRRGGAAVFAGETSVGRIRRTFAELAEHLFRCQTFPHGAVLLTGTGIVPPDSFTLQAGDVVDVDIEGVGLLRNPVVVV